MEQSRAAGSRPRRKPKASGIVQEATAAVVELLELLDGAPGEDPWRDVRTRLKRQRTRAGFQQIFDRLGMLLPPFELEYLSLGQRVRSADTRRRRPMSYQVWIGVPAGAVHPEQPSGASPAPRAEEEGVPYLLGVLFVLRPAPQPQGLLVYLVDWPGWARLKDRRLELQRDLDTVWPWLTWWGDDETAGDDLAEEDPEVDDLGPLRPAPGPDGELVLEQATEPKLGRLSVRALLLRAAGRPMPRDELELHLGFQLAATGVLRPAEVAKIHQRLEGWLMSLGQEPRYHRVVRLKAKQNGVRSDPDAEPFSFKVIESTLPSLRKHFMALQFPAPGSLLTYAEKTLQRAAMKKKRRPDRAPLPDDAQHDEDAED